MDRILDTAGNWRAVLMRPQQERALPHTLPRSNLTALYQRFEHFLDEKGVAIGQCVETLQQARMDRAMQCEDSLEHGVDLVARKTRQNHFMSEMPTIKRSEPMPETSRHLVVAVRE